MDNTARLNQESWLLPFWWKEDTSSRGGVRDHSQYTAIYSFFERWGEKTKQNTEVFGNSGQTINKSTFGDDAQGELMGRANRSSFQLEDCFPMVPEFYRAAKKPDSQPSRRSIVEERILCWLCKLKPFKAEQAENQHGLQFVPSAWLVALWNLTVSGGADIQAGQSDSG